MAKMSTEVRGALSVLHQLIGEAIGANEEPKDEPKEEAKPPARRKPAAKAEPKEVPTELTKKQMKVAAFLEKLELDAKALREICEYLDMEDVSPRQRAKTSVDWLVRNCTIKQIKEAIEE